MSLSKINLEAVAKVKLVIGKFLREMNERTLKLRMKTPVMLKTGERDPAVSEVPVISFLYEDGKVWTCCI